MSEHLSAERRLADLVSAYADRAPSDLDPMAVTRLAATRQRQALTLRIGFVPAGLWFALLVMAMLVAIAAGVLVAGGRGTPVDPSAMRADAEPPPTQVGPIGLPPAGATPSAPETGELVLHYWGPNPGGYGRIRVWVYADGRLIWLPAGNLLREAAVAPWSRFFERRLTPEGVELMRSEVLAISVLDDERAATAIPLPFPQYLGLQVRTEGRLVDITRVVSSPTDLVRLEARLSDPISWLPERTWVDDRIRAFVPFHYAVCFDDGRLDLQPSQILALLPASARNVLGGRLEADAGQEHCADVSTEEAHTLDTAFRDAWFGGMGATVTHEDYALDYELEVPGPSAGFMKIGFEPYLPHGEVTCSGCG